MDLCEKKINSYIEGIERMIYDTGASYFDFIFGNCEVSLDIIRKFFLLDSNLFSYDNSTGLFREDGVHVGIEQGYSDTKYPRLLIKTVRDGFVLLKLLSFFSVLSRALFVALVTTSIPRNSYYIAYFSVSPEFRGKGYGNTMMQKTLTRLRSAGYHKCVLDVEADNVSAIKLYKACGFSITGSARPKGNILGLKPRFRMEVKL